MNSERPHDIIMVDAGCPAPEGYVLLTDLEAAHVQCMPEYQRGEWLREKKRKQEEARQQTREGHLHVAAEEVRAAKEEMLNQVWMGRIALGDKDAEEKLLAAMGDSIATASIKIAIADLAADAHRTRAAKIPTPQDDVMAAALDMPWRARHPEQQSPSEQIQANGDMGIRGNLERPQPRTRLSASEKAKAKQKRKARKQARKKGRR